MLDKDLLSIELNALRFYAFHGVYEEEAKTGNEFEVNASVSFDAGKEVINKLNETINYVRLYEIIKDCMSRRENLLEALVMKIAGRIHHEFPAINEVKIQLKKIQPPIASFEGSVSVTYKKRF